MSATRAQSYAQHERMSGANQALLVKLGKRVQTLRKKKEWTQTDMAVYLT
jgi:hypothetical protein